MRKLRDAYAQRGRSLKERLDRVTKLIGVLKRKLIEGETGAGAGELR